MKQILQCNPFKVIFYHFVEVFPHGKSFARGYAGALVGIVVKTGDWRQTAFCQFKDAAHSVLSRLPCQLVAAAFAAEAF